MERKDAVMWVCCICEDDAAKVLLEWKGLELMSAVTPIGIPEANSLEHDSIQNGVECSLVTD